MSDIVKICKKHGLLSVSNCYFNKITKNYRCKKCLKEYAKKNIHKIRESRVIQPNRLNRNLGTLKIEKNEYLNLLSIQKNRCAICKDTETKFNKNGSIKRLSIDHCHKSHFIRGLLCNNCNHLIGNSKDSIEILKSAIAYLKKHEDNN